MKKYMATFLITEEGLSIKEKNAVREYLYLFHLATEREWRPRNCRAIPSLGPQAQQAYIATDLPHHFQPPEPRRLHHWHFFLINRALTNEERILIVDPTGVPEEYPNLDSKIIPYLGLLESAPASHQKVYSRHQPMDNWGTREFPPGFHP